MGGGGYYQGKGGGKGGGGGKGSGGGKGYEGKPSAESPAAAPAAAPRDDGGGWSVAGGGGARAAVADVSLPGGLVRKLRALHYPELDSASLGGQAYCKIVLWLEEEKIRLYDKLDRKPLREFNKAWYIKVAEYCKDLGVDAEGLSERDIPKKLRVLNSLTNLAVHDIYRDKVEADELQAAPPAKPVNGEEKQRLRLLVPTLNQLLGSFRLPKLQDTAADDDTLAALRCVQVRVCPSKEGAGGNPIDLDNLPLGLQINDPDVKRAAAVLRILHGQQLQQLQVNINTVINELQQLTADPKTDSRLGRVGR